MYKQIKNFEEYLYEEEKSPITIEKYIRDCEAFMQFIEDEKITKEKVMAYKHKLVKSGYKVRSVNSMIASVNAFLVYIGRADCRVKSLKLQKQTYIPKDKELTKAEYYRICNAAKKDERLYLIIQTICSTGIRVSELKHITVEAVKQGEATVYCKGKNRTIMIPEKLRHILMKYICKQGIKTGEIFITRTGKSVDRSYIWAQMKKLCKTAMVNSSKVFPHNLRKLFARAFYAIEKDIAKLADVLGHSNIETTRIYIMTTGVEHKRKIEKMGLVV